MKWGRHAPRWQVGSTEPGFPVSCPGDRPEPFLCPTIQSLNHCQVTLGCVGYSSDKAWNANRLPQSILQSFPFIDRIQGLHGGKIFQNALPVGSIPFNLFCGTIILRGKLMLVIFSSASDIRGLSTQQNFESVRKCLVVKDTVDCRFLVLHANGPTR